MIELERTGGVSAGEKAVVVGEWRSADSSVLKQRGITHLEVNYARGFRGSDVEFLASVPEVTVLDLVLSHETDDIGGVSHLSSSLVELNLTSDSQTEIDFGLFRNLERSSLTWTTQRKSILAAPQMRSLHINGFPGADLQAFGSLRAINSLRLSEAPKLSTLNGAERLEGLREFGVYHCPKLLEWVSLAAATGLEVLEIERCKNLMNLDWITGLRKIRELSVLDCGEIASLEPLSELKELETFFFYESTNVKDGDLTVLVDLPKLRDTSFQDRRHYSLQREAVRQHLVTRSLSAWSE